MKLTKKLEAEILKAYHEYWNAYLKGDMQAMSYWLHEDVQMIGSGRGEFFKNKKQTLKYYKSTAAQVAGKADMRNRKINVTTVGNQILVSEECDFFVLIDSVWTFYEQGRISTLFVKTNKGWKIIEEHGSMPDARTAEGEQVNTDKIKAENIRLKDAVKRRTIELEEKNHELKIETSLEKVRAVAMGMTRPDDLLNICRSLFNELRRLRFTEIRNAIINTFENKKPFFLDYDYSDLLGGTITKIPINENTIIKNHLKRIKKSTDAFSETIVPQSEIKKWIADRRKRGEPEDPRLKKLKLLCYYFYSIGPAAIGISTYRKIGEEKLEILKRFRNVFKLSYQRYIDIAKAEAQAQEAQLESALERVRAVVMAMHTPGDLSGIGKTIYQQLKSLGFSGIRNTEIIINNDNKERIKTYHYSDYGKAEIIEINYKENPIVKKWANDLRKADNAFVPVSIPKREIKKWDQYRKKIGYKNDPKMSKANAVYYYSYSIGLGALSVSSWQQLHEEQIKTLERFRNVFNLSYKRYIDIAKAEAQAREAEIELALERVRARSLAMHHTSELQDVVNITAQQLLGIGMDINGGVFICINSEVDKELPVWASGGMADYMHKVIVPVLNKPIFLNARNAIKKGNSFLIESFSDKEKQELFTHLFNYEPWKNLSTGRKKELLSRKGGFARSIVISQHTSISITNHNGKAFTDEENKILKRFGKVFEQTYIRFLDLQKAEAQAREAQIEAAVERVRAISLAMHHSDEIHEVVRTLRHELFGLKLEGIGGATICLKQPDGQVRFWDITDTEISGKYTWDILFDMTKIDPHLWVKRIWNSRKKIISAEQDSADLKRALKWLGQYNKKTADDISKLLKANKITHGWHRAVKLARGILITDFSNSPPAEIDSILLKISAAFDLAYQRFLDLQKAEAQAREAQIEASLERVRSRAMAMHTSNELKEVAKEMRNQLHLLGQKELETCAIHLWDEPTGQFEAWAALRSPDNTGKIIESESKFKIKGIKILEENFQHYRDGKKDYVLINDVAKARQFFEALKTADPKAYAFLSPTIKNKKSRDISAYWAVADFAGGSLVMVTMNPPEENSRALLRRFADVFGLAYRRFSDLQKAEAQAREAQIQLALERVRARTMAMQRSDELTEVAGLLFNQLTDLGIKTWTTGFNVWSEDNNFYTDYITSPKGGFIPPYIVDLSKTSVFREIRDARKKGIEFFVQYADGEALKQTYIELAAFGDEKQYDKMLEDGVQFPSHQYDHFVFGSKVSLMFITYEPVPEVHDIFKRFGKVFEQTYTRFLDLQKAEAQAKEAQIEVALEKVRSRTMAMQKSEELKDVINLVYEQLTHLNIHVEHCGFLIDYKTRDDLHIWLADEHLAPSEVIFPWFDCPPNNAIREAKDKGEDFFFYHLNFEEKNKFYRDLFKLIPGIPEETVDYYLNCPGLAGSGVLLESIGLYIENFSGTVYSAEENAVLMRFGKVFQQTYTRFLDLQKAEAQAREAQIEAALERVRARTMAMQKSAELNPTADLLFEQLRLLGAELQGVAFAICDKDNDIVQKWTSIGVFSFSSSIEPAEQNMYEAWKNKIPLYEEVFEGERIKKYYETLMEVPAFKQGLQQLLDAGIPIPTWQKNHAVSFQQGYLLIITKKPFAETQIFIRFGKVFEQTYTRFLDLQKAEMQAREAKIEVSLEKVRTVALILKKSDEMLDVVQALYEALYDLGFTNIRNSIIDVHNPQKETFLDYDYSPQLGRSITEMSYYDSPFIENQVRKTEADNDAFFELILEGKELQELIDMRLKNGEAEDPRLRQTKQLTYNLYSFGNGAIGISNFGLLSDEQKEILKRFRNVFAFAYKRYSDMVQAEALAREAQIEAALEKVRSRTLAMQKSDELADTAAVLFQQLITLGIAPNRLFIIIMKAGSSDLEAWVTDEDGSKVSLGFTANYQNNPSIQKMYEGWQQQKKSLVIDMQGEELQQYFHYLHDELKVPFKGGLEQKRRIQHLAYFSHGLIGMASPEEQPAETIQLLERFAAVFNLTFTRFNDLKIAEAHAIQAEQDLIAIKEAKQKAEEALTELQSTQKQLIQSEKMASLGELTAGIAHEIQNPLNFVNNFSEVSKELLDEMKEAIEKGDTEDAKQIMNDVIQNLEKINHHGKRADGIVKGMLQHSRSSTGQKELTDINVLCDEYLRLSYHGLRAKDKTFNAKFETSFDESIGKVNIVPQEIGRVILNLINNAFYAVSEKKKMEDENYEPTVIVSTKKENETVLISVKDNGNGIPENIKDKIFQPFFTTKPTGQGTGLGLSLSYDIVKAHGGEVNVNTKEGEGAAFIIQLTDA